MKNSPPSPRFVGFGRVRLRTLIFSDRGKRQGILDPFSPWRRPGWSRIGVLVGWNVLRLLIGSRFWTMKRVIGASYCRFLGFPMGCRCSVSWWESSRSLWCGRVGSGYMGDFELCVYLQFPVGDVAAGSGYARCAEVVLWMCGVGFGAGGVCCGWAWWWEERIEVSAGVWRGKGWVGPTAWHGKGARWMQRSIPPW